MAIHTKGKDRVKTTQTALVILEHLRENNGMGITELASESGLAKSTVHRHLSTLCDEGYVVKEGDTYHIGLRFLNFGENAKNRKEEYSMAEEKVEELAEETEERVQFIVEEHGYSVYVHRALGRHAVRTDPGIGKRIPLHSVAAGKSILAHMSEEDVWQIIEDRGLPKITKNTITDSETLFEELEMIREQGYSVNDQENLDGLKAIGAPILGADGQVIGALSVSGPTHRMKGEYFESELPDLLLGVVNELELNIAYS
jgi:DNA-binding IclR family transcriptional regulator